MEVDFQALVDAAPALIAVFDRDRRLLYGNAALERGLARPLAELIGKQPHELFRARDAQLWRDALDRALRTGTQVELDYAAPSPQGPRRFAALLAPLPGQRVCAMSRDVTDFRAGRLLMTGARTMTTGMVIVEAPSGAVLFQNEEVERIFGRPSRPVEGIDSYDAIVAFDRAGRRIDNRAWPIVRALGGETIVAEPIEVLRHDGDRRIISINASPVRADSGEILAAVSTYADVTEARRAHQAATYLAQAGALLERFDPDSTLQAIVDLAVPKLADWCYVHLKSSDPASALPRIAAIANAVPGAVERARALVAQPQPLSADTAVARVLAGGPRELVQVDDTVLQHAARDATHLQHLRTRGYTSAVVAPLPGREGVLGALTFSMSDSGRRYTEADLDMLAELARRTGIALDNARLFEAEQQARRQAEAARDRTRRLQQLTEALSGAVEKEQVASIMVDAGREALGAAAGFVWLLGAPDRLELVARQFGGSAGWVDDFTTIPMTAQMPICDVVRSGQPLMFESLAALRKGYRDAGGQSGSPFHAWMVMPFVVGGRGIGAVSFSFDRERAFSEEDRQLSAAMIGQVSLALERVLLLESERRARAEAEAARSRERQLHQLAARLSGARTPHEVTALSAEDVRLVLGAVSAGIAVRVGDEVQILGIVGMHDPDRLAKVARVPVTFAAPPAEAIHRGQIVWTTSEAELAARYPHLEASWRGRGTRSWGAVPFSFEGRTIGAISLSFNHECELSASDRDFLQAVGELTAQALERARLYEALKSSDEQLRSALSAARAATWSVDLTTMEATRDASYRELLELSDEHATADFSPIHPDDQPIARAAYDRSLRDGVPYTPEVRVRRGDGSYTWIRSHGRVLAGPDGKPRVMAGVIVDIDAQKRASLRADEERRINDTLNRLGGSFASELDHDRLVQLITDEITRLVGAEVGVFFTADGQDVYTRSTGRANGLGAGPLATPLLVETLVEHRPVRLDDVTQDSRYGLGDVHPAGQAVVRSYLAVPVLARTGDIYGSLLFGHAEPGQFTESHQRLASSIATQAAVALENARLYKTVRDQKEQLEQAVERARLADRRKDEFLAMLGHELRNPLAPIATALDLMNLKGDATLQKERDVIRRQVDHLSRLVDDLLDVSRITRGKIQLFRETTEVAAILAKAIEMASPLLERRMQELSIDVPRQGLTIDADPTRLAQVFQNLLINAAKYSEPHTAITLRARSQGQSVLVEISDQGIGIPADLINEVFDVFVQGRRAIDRTEGGLGLGLAIARSICELHGGRIEAASPGVGRGSTFTVTLPLVAQTDVATGPAASGPIVRTAGQCRVLVVDDNVDAALLLHEFLGTLGHDAAVAHDGPAALELARQFRPDVAVLDIGLPVMDGYELARRLRAQHDGAPLRLIAVTGYGQDSDRARSQQAGFDHHLVKPIALDVLMPLLAKDA